MNETYEYLECDTCNRRTRRTVNPERLPINKCNITYKCRGTLQFLTRSNKEIDISDIPSDNIQNWKSRHAEQTVYETPDKNPMYNILGTNQALTIGFGNPTNVSSFMLKCEQINNEQKTYFEYTYFAGDGESLIGGPDNTINRNILRFTDQDTVKVLVNGIEYGQDRIRLNVPSTIELVIPLSEPDNVITVIVIKHIEPTYKYIKFDKITSNNVVDVAWGNVKEIFFQNNVDAKYEIFVCTNINNTGDDNYPGLSIDEEYVLVSDPTVDENVVGTRSFFLFSNAPHTNFDRSLNNYLPIESSDRVLTYKIINGIPELLVQESSISSIFPPLFVGELYVQNEGKSNTSSDTRELVNKYIN